jgi:hypothetical protein
MDEKRTRAHPLVNNLVHNKLTWALQKQNAHPQNGKCLLSSAEELLGLVMCPSQIHWGIPARYLQKLSF